MGAQLAQMGMGVADTIMAGRYSSADLAGVALGTSILWPSMMLDGRWYFQKRVYLVLNAEEISG